MTLANLVVTTAYNDSSNSNYSALYAPLRVSSSNNPVTQTIEIVNPTSSIVIATVAIPMSHQESSRTWTAANITGTVSGLTASGTNGIADTLTLDPGEKCRYTLVSTYTGLTTPFDSQNETVDVSTSTIVATVTETTVAGVSVTDPDPFYYPFRSVWFRHSSAVSPNKDPFFQVRTRNADQILSGLVERMNDNQVARLIDYIESGGSIADVLVPEERILAAYFPGHATAGSAVEQVLGVMPVNGRVISVQLVTNTAVTGANTNYFTLNVRNRQQTDGTGTLVPATLDFTSGVNTVALTPKTIPVSSTFSNTVFVRGDVFSAEKAVTASGLACPPGIVVVRYTTRV